MQESRFKNSIYLQKYWESKSEFSPLPSESVSRSSELLRACQGWQIIMYVKAGMCGMQINIITCLYLVPVCQTTWNTGNSGQKRTGQARTYWVSACQGCIKMFDSWDVGHSNSAAGSWHLNLTRGLWDIQTRQQARGISTWLVGCGTFKLGSRLVVSQLDSWAVGHSNSTAGSWHFN